MKIFNSITQVKCEVNEKKLHRMRATGDFKVLHFKVLRVVWLVSEDTWGASTRSVKYSFSEVPIQ